MSKQSAVDDELLLPASEMTNEGAEAGMGEEIPIVRVCVSGIEKLLRGLLGYTTNAFVSVGVGRGIEYAIAWGCAGAKHARVREVGEVARREDVGFC